MEETIVYTKQGPLRGLAEAEKGVKVWKGIPYAQPPVGTLRFRAPQPMSNWEGVREAVSYGAICPQPDPSSGSMTGNLLAKPVESEDCLYLNVWSPVQNTSADGKPVMVWIHGGAFVTGSGSILLYDGANLAHSGDVVVVTLNYRLGALGFLHLSPLGMDLTSNAGLLDQIAALEWVKDNISAFGGDPERITVFGESAGSMSIAALLTMPKAKGLFQQAIMQSGASQIMPDEQAKHIAMLLLHELGVDPQHPERLFTLPTEAIQSAVDQIYQKTGASSMTLLFQPVVDAQTLPTEPIAAIQAGTAQHIPLLIGTNHDEGAYFVRDSSQLMSEAAVAEALTMMTGMADAGELSRHYPNTVEGQGKMMTDLFFWRLAVRYAEEQAKHAPVWMYRFDWTLPGHPLLGKAVHAAEIAFVFHNLELLSKLGVQVTDEMQLLAGHMQHAWATFAHTGHPQVPGLEWTGYHAENRATMMFDQQLTVLHDPDADKRRLFAGAGSI